MTTNESASKPPATMRVPNQSSLFIPSSGLKGLAHKDAS
jgi:hypothetical protein